MSRKSVQIPLLIPPFDVDAINPGLASLAPREAAKPAVGQDGRWSSPEAHRKKYVCHDLEAALLVASGPGAPMDVHRGLICAVWRS
jgi:hypothetical protein